MNRLWDYKDCVNHLSHQNKIVRRWSFAATENHYPNRYTDEVCNPIGDEAHSAVGVLRSHPARAEFTNFFGDRQYVGTKQSRHGICPI